jgi:putative DNA primase/helicase
VDFAEERFVALIGITHFTKGTQGKEPIERITGSLAYAAMARIVLGATKGEDNAPRRFLRIASNIGKSDGGFEYMLRQDPVPSHDFKAQKVLWGRQITGEARALLNAAEQPQSERLKGMVFLEEILSEAGEAGITVKELKAAAEANGFSWRTLERARSGESRIQARKVGAVWRWIWQV